MDLFRRELVIRSHGAIGLKPFLPGILLCPVGSGNRLVLLIYLAHNPCLNGSSVSYVPPTLDAQFPAIGLCGRPVAPRRNLHCLGHLRAPWRRAGLYSSPTDITVIPLPARPTRSSLRVLRQCHLHRIRRRLLAFFVRAKFRIPVPYSPPAPPTPRGFPSPPMQSAGRARFWLRPA